MTTATPIAEPVATPQTATDHATMREAADAIADAIALADEAKKAIADARLRIQNALGTMAKTITDSNVAGRRLPGTDGLTYDNAACGAYAASAALLTKKQREGLESLARNTDTAAFSALLGK